MEERSQEELRSAVVSKFGAIKELEESKIFGRLYSIVGDPESGAFSLHYKSTFPEDSDYSLLGEIDERKIVANRRRGWLYEDQTEKVIDKQATVLYQDGLVECQYSISPQTEAAVITLTQVGLGEHSMRYAIGAVYLEGRLGTVSVALGEGVKDWTKQIVFSIDTEPLKVTTKLGDGQEEKLEAVALDKLFNLPKILPYGFIIQQEGCNLSFLRIFLENSKSQFDDQRNWLLTLPIKTDFHHLNAQVKTEKDWAKIYESLPVNLEMLSGDQLLKRKLKKLD